MYNNTSLSSHARTDVRPFECGSTNQYRSITPTSNHRLMQHKADPSQKQDIYEENNERYQHHQLQANKLIITSGSQLEDSWSSPRKQNIRTGPPAPMDYPVLRKSIQSDFRSQGSARGEKGNQFIGTYVQRTLNDSLQEHQQENSIRTDQPSSQNRYHRASSHDDSRRIANSKAKQLQRQMEEAIALSKKTRQRTRDIQASFGIPKQQQRNRSTFSKNTIESINSNSTGRRNDYRSALELGPTIQRADIKEYRTLDYKNPKIQSRSISPGLGNRSSALRQPLNFIKEVNSGSLSPHLNRSRISSKNEQYEQRNDDQIRQVDNYQNMQYQHHHLNSLDPKNCDSVNMHVNNTAYFPGRGTQNNSLNMSRGQQYHAKVKQFQGESIGGMVNMLDRSQLQLSSIDHAASCSYVDPNTTSIQQGIPLDISNCYSPEKEEFRSQFANNYVDQQNIPASQFTKLKQLSPNQYPHDSFNDTAELDRSYNQLSNQIRKQQSSGQRHHPLVQQLDLPKQIYATSQTLDPQSEFQMQFYQHVSGNSTSRSHKGSYISRSGKQSRQLSHRSRSQKNSIRQSQQKQKNLHQREMSFQQLNYTRGSARNNEVLQERNTNQRQFLAEEPVYNDLESSEHKYVESSEKNDYKNQTQSFSNSEGGKQLRSHKSSHRSKSADQTWNLPRDNGNNDGPSGLQKINHFRPQERNQNLNYILDFNSNSQYKETRIDQSELSGLTDIQNNRNSKSEEEDSLKHKKNSRHSPRFSQGDEFGINASHMNIMDQSREISLEKPKNARYATPNDSQIIDMHDFQHNNTNHATSQQHHHQATHFNTEELIKMTQLTLQNYKQQLKQERLQKLKQQIPEIQLKTSVKNKESIEWSSEFQESQLNKTHDDLKELRQYENEMILQSNDDTFRGENFVQQSFRDGIISVGTQEGSYISRNKAPTPATIMQQQQSPEKIYSNFQSSYYNTGLQTQLVSTQGIINQGMSGESSMNEIGTGEGGTTMLSTQNVSKLSQKLKNENRFLGKQNQILNKRFASLKFSELVEKLWYKQKMKKVHENLTQTLQVALQANNKQQRVDAYSTHTNYKSINIVDLMNQIKTLSKNVLKEVIIQQNSQKYNASHGLSKLSDIDSNYQISKLSPREYKSTTSNAAFGQKQQATNNNAFKQLNHGYASTSTFHSKVDIDHLQEMESQMQQMQNSKEESEVMVNNLKKTQKDLLKKIKSLESRLQTIDINNGFQNTPSLTNISPRCKSEAGGKGSKSDLQINLQQMKFLESQLAMKENNSQVLRHELDDKESIISELKTKHSSITNDMKEKFRLKLEQQNGLIDQLKTELESAMNRNQDFHHSQQNNGQEMKQLKDKLEEQTEERERLDNQLNSLNRQMMMLKNQLHGEKTTHEADERRLKNLKEQEQHWKTGYETMFAKYTKLKESIVQKDQYIHNLEDENDRKLKNVTRKAEDAIRYFKRIAISQVGKDNVPNYQSTSQMETQSKPFAVPEKAKAFELHEAEARVSRFSRKVESESKSSMCDLNNYRSRSMHSPYINSPSKKYIPQSISRQGEQVTPSRGYSHINTANGSNNKHDGVSDSNYNLNRRKSYSPIPIRVNLDGSMNTGLSKMYEKEQQEKRASLSPNANKRLHYIQKIQSQFTDSKDKENGENNFDPKVLIAIEALQHAFNEVSAFKRQSLELSSKYYNVNCKQLQNFQVLSYDYQDQINEFLKREDKLKDELKAKQVQIGQLRDIVHNSSTMIKSLQAHLREQKQLKENQWKNIIQYDEFKSLEKKRINNAVTAEARRTKEAIKKLHQEIENQQRSLMDRSQEIQLLEQDKYSIENQLSQMRNLQEETDNELKQVNVKKEENEQKLRLIELQIKEVLFDTCGGLESKKNTLNSTQTIAKQNINTPSKTALGTAANETMDQDHGQISISRYQFTPQLKQNGNENEPDTIPTKESRPNGNQHTPPIIRMNMDNVQSASVSFVQGNTSSCNIQQNSPMMPLEWLHQIKSYVQSLQRNLLQEKSYFGSLKDLLTQKDLNFASQAMRVEDQANSKSINCFTSSQNYISNEEHETTDQREFQRSVEGTEYVNNYVSQNDKGNLFHNISGISNVKRGSTGNNSQAVIVTSNISSANVSQYQQQQKMMFNKKKNDENLHQSLESFVKQNHQAFATVTPECGSPVLSELIHQRHDVGGPSRHRHFETFNENSPQFEQQDNGASYEEAREPHQTHFPSMVNLTHDIPKNELFQKLNSLLEDSTIKSRTILSMKQEMESINFDKNMQFEQAREEINSLQQEVVQIHSEKEQISNIYQQENQMRQDLEIEVDRLQQDLDQSQRKIQTMSERIDYLKEENDINLIEKQKMEQSSEYWQNSFKMIEQSYLEEKEKSEAEIQSLQSTLDSTRSEYSQMEEQLNSIGEEHEELMGFRNAVVYVRQNMKTTNCQTDKTMDDIVKMRNENDQLGSENRQIRRDIAVLIESYDNHKQESKRALSSHKEQMDEMQSLKRAELDEKDKERELIIKRLSSEIQEQISIRHRKEDELRKQESRVKELEESLNGHKGKNDEQVKQIESQNVKEIEQLSCQVEELKDQVKNTTKMHETISQFNQQLLSQISNLQEVKNIKNQNTQKRLGGNKEYIDIKESNNNILFSDPSNVLLNSFSIGQFAKDGDFNLLSAHSKEAKMMMTDNSFLMNINSAKNSENKRQGAFQNQGDTFANTITEPNVVTFLSENCSAEGPQNQHQEQISKNIEMLKYLKNITNQNSLSNIDESVEINTQSQQTYNQNHQQTQQYSAMQSNQGTEQMNRSYFQGNVKENDFNKQQVLGRHSSKGDLQYEHNMNMPRASANIEKNQNQSMYQANMSIQQNGWQEGQMTGFISPNLGQMNRSYNESYNHGMNQHQISIHTANDRNNINTSLGLDMCQSCIEYQSMIAPQQELISQYVSSYLNQVRKLTSICMEGSMLLRLNNKPTLSKINQQSQYSSQNSLNVNGPKIMTNDVEMKTQFIRDAQKFFQNDVSNFLNPSQIQYSGQLFQYGDEMIDIAQQIVQNSCDITISQLQAQQLSIQNIGTLQSKQSLKIQDYSVSTNTFGTQTQPFIVQNKESHIHMEHQVLSDNKDSQLRRDPNVLADIENLGTSLDQKINTFVKLLMSLKSTHIKQKKDEQVSKLIQSLVGVISKMIHDLTEDTKQLGDIKTKLQDSDEDRAYSYSQTLPQSKTVSKESRSRNDMQYAKNSTNTMQQQMRPESASSDLPLQRNDQRQRNVYTGTSVIQEINFVEDETDQPYEESEETYIIAESGNIIGHRESQRQTANFELQQTRERNQQPYQNNFYKQNPMNNNIPVTSNETIFSDPNTFSNRGNELQTFQNSRGELFEQQVQSYMDNKLPVFAIKPPQNNIKSESQPTNRTYGSGTSLEAGRSRRTTGNQNSHYEGTTSNYNGESETDGQITDVSASNTNRQQRQEHQQFESQSNHNVQNLISDINSLYGQNKYQDQRNEQIQLKQERSKHVSKTRKSQKPITHLKKSKSRESRRNNEEYDDNNGNQRQNKEYGQSPRSFLNNVNYINQNSGQLILIEPENQEQIDRSSTSQLIAYHKSKQPIQNQNQPSQILSSRLSQEKDSSSRRNSNRPPKQIHNNHNQYVQEKVYKNKEAVARVMQDQLQYQDSTGYEGTYDIGSNGELYPVMQVSGYEHQARTHNQNQASQNRPPQKKSNQYKSSKSFVVESSDQYQIPYQNGPNSKIEYEQNKFLQSFNSQNRPPLIHPNKAYQTQTSQNTHLISVADPEFTQSSNANYFKQPTLQEQFHRKFETTTDPLLTQSRSKSHEKVNNTQVYSSFKNINMNSQRSRFEQTQGSFDNNRVQKRHRFDVSNN